MVAVLPEIVLFAAYGIIWLAGSLDRMVPRPPWRAVLCLVVAFGFLAGTFVVPRAALRFTGFAAATRLLASKADAQSPAFLVISDEKAEGAAVAELAIDQGWPGASCCVAARSSSARTGRAEAPWTAFRPKPQWRNCSTRSR
jgi:hypothetical protein